MAEWKLFYHNILNISNLFHVITSSRLSFRETDLHHELGGSISTLLNQSTRKAKFFLNSKRKSLSFDIVKYNKVSSFHDKAMCKQKWCWPYYKYHRRWQEAICKILRRTLFKKREKAIRYKKTPFYLHLNRTEIGKKKRQYTFKIFWKHKMK